ncbi:MAG: lytic transglycosylase domain-containing protein [Candidatus Micrarchaeales archaeon]
MEITPTIPTILRTEKSTISKIEKPTEYLWQPSDRFKSIPKDELWGMILKASNRHQVNPVLIAAVIQSESWGDPTLIGSKGEIGLMQLKRSSTKYTREQLLDPQTNIYAGTVVLKENLNRSKNLDMALALYNVGDEKVGKHGGIPKFARPYINSVKRHMQEIERKTTA